MTEEQYQIVLEKVVKESKFQKELPYKLEISDNKGTIIGPKIKTENLNVDEARSLHALLNTAYIRGCLAENIEIYDRLFVYNEEPETIFI